MKNTLLFFLITYGAMHLNATAQAGNMQLPQVVFTWTKGDVQNYQAMVESIVKSIQTNPKTLDVLPLRNLKKLSYSIDGPYVKDKLSPAEWLKLRTSEIMLMGLIIHSLTSRIDPSIDKKQMQQISFLPYEAAYPDPKDQADSAKRKAYNDSINLQIKKETDQTAQIVLSSILKDCMDHTRGYLKMLYPDPKKMDPDILTTFRAAGLDQATINQLYLEKGND